MIIDRSSVFTFNEDVTIMQAVNESKSKCIIAIILKVHVHIS